MHSYGHLGFLAVLGVLGYIGHKDESVFEVLALDRHDVKITRSITLRFQPAETSPVTNKAWMSSESSALSIPSKKTSMETAGRSLQVPQAIPSCYWLHPHCGPYLGRPSVQKVSTSKKIMSLGQTRLCSGPRFKLRCTQNSLASTKPSVELSSCAEIFFLYQRLRMCSQNRYHKMITDL